MCFLQPMMILHMENLHWSGLLTDYRIQPELDSLTATHYGGCHVSVTLDASTSMTCVTSVMIILVLSWNTSMIAHV